jgi:hypothetical protein
LLSFPNHPAASRRRKECHVPHTKFQAFAQPIELLPFDERALELPPMPDDVFDELVGDMKRRGFRPQFPIITHNGKIIEGVSRARTSVKAGVEPVYQQFDGKDEDVDRFIIQANLCRRHLKPEERRDLLKKLLKMSPEQSDRTIATMAKVSPTTVGSVRRELGSNVQVGHKDRVEKSGRKARGRKPGSGKTKPEPAKEITLPAADCTKVDPPPPVEKPSEEERPQRAAQADIKQPIADVADLEVREWIAAWTATPQSALQPNGLRSTGPNCPRRTWTLCADVPRTFPTKS